MATTKTSTAGTDGRIPVAEYLSIYDPFVRRPVRELIKVARSVAGDIGERAYRGWGLWMISDRGEISVAGARDHAKVRMRAGAAEHDPSKLLRGTGKSR